MDRHAALRHLPLDLGEYSVGRLLLMYISRCHILLPMYQLTLYSYSYCQLFYAVSLWSRQVLGDNSSHQSEDDPAWY